jgi:hypothetical protein
MKIATTRKVSAPLVTADGRFQAGRYCTVGRQAARQQASDSRQQGEVGDVAEVSQADRRQ